MFLQDWDFIQLFSRLYLSFNAKEISNHGKNVPWCSPLDMCAVIQLHITGLDSRDELVVVTRGREKATTKICDIFLTYFPILIEVRWGFLPDRDALLKVSKQTCHSNQENGTLVTWSLPMCKPQA